MLAHFLIGLGLGGLAGAGAAMVWHRRARRRVRRLEERTRRAERLAQMADMTRGLAHEIKNPLSTVGLNVQLLQEDLEQLARDAASTKDVGERVGRMRRRLASLRGETGRLRDVLDDFLRFAGRIELDRGPTDINELVAELIDFFEPQAESAGVKVTTSLNAHPPFASIDGPLLKQAVLNLLLNATQAMESARLKDDLHGGADTLHIETRRVDGSRDPELLIRVRDNGPGIPDESMPRLFKPYFSTKREGTGLGLPTARRIVEEHGGTLQAHTESGRGATFEVNLPYVEAGAGQGDAPQTPSCDA